MFIKWDKKYCLDNHKRTIKHINNKENKREKRCNGGNGSVQTFIQTNDETFNGLVAKSFIAAEIPLYKLRNTHLKGLFSHMSYALPSETSVRRYIKENL